ncbi:MAG TPA: hypothetical protein VEK57_17625 [Thermoanaerobaculia bacterium]|nr:hypothetical protein [Thermoanaerobaculia bacterium]
MKLTLLQDVPTPPTGELATSCVTFLITWAPLAIILILWLLYLKRMGFTSRGGYIKRSEDHMERVEQTLTRIEEHLRKIAERENDRTRRGEGNNEG